MIRFEAIHESTVVEKDEHRKSKEYKKLSPKMRIAINDVYSMINRTTDPIVSKIEGIIRSV